MKKYPYAVMDGNRAPDQSSRPESCHMTLRAAVSAAQKENAKNPNYHYYVIDWCAPRNARLRPNDAHYPDYDGDGNKIR